jgi:hypothetical protein
MLLVLRSVPFRSFLFCILPCHIFQLRFLETQILTFYLSQVSFEVSWTVVDGQPHLSVIEGTCQFIRVMIIYFEQLCLLLL